MAPRLVIVGSPGAGKTTVGRRSAEALGLTFVDTDRVIERDVGMSVADIFVNSGEDTFRDLEEEAVATAIAEQDGVVALGGGAILRDATRERLRDQPVLWLRVTASDAAGRVGLNTARPLLLGNVRATLTSLLEQRNPLYESVATYVVDTGGKSIRQVTDEVVEVVRGA